MIVLTEATTTEIVQELKRRCPCGIVALDGVSLDGKYDVALCSWGTDYFVTLGLATEMVSHVMGRRSECQGDDDTRYTGQ